MRGIPLHQNPVAKTSMMDCALSQVFTSLEDLLSGHALLLMRISLDGESESSTRVEMYDRIHDKKGEAFVSDGANRPTVGTYVSENGTKCIRTYADGNWTNNLLSLPECV